MNIHALDGQPAPAMAAALAALEARFRYPLGPERSFRIDHGADPTRFARAIGPARVFAAERHGTVIGCLAVSIRRLHAPGGQRTAAYFGDLKVAPEARGLMVLPSLLRAASAWAHAHADCAYAVVMDGTPVTPDRYTGRLGIPAMAACAALTVLRVPAGGRSDPAWHSGAAACQARRRELLAGRLAGERGCAAATRSAMAPVALLAPDGSACGIVEDTRLAKRLVIGDSELVSAHLGCAAWRDSCALAALLRQAAAVAATAGLPAVFAALPVDESAPAQLGPNVTVAPATVYGHGLPPGLPWLVDTAEI